MRTVALMNPAGSTAKSTVGAALAHLAARNGRRVLAIDLDPQGNLTGWLGASRDTAGITQAVRAVVTNDPASWPGVDDGEVRADLHRQLQRTIQHTPLQVDVIAADAGVRALMRSWADLRPRPELLLRDLLAALEESYDVVILDCKGDLGVLSEAALRACDDVIGVATPTTKSLQGLPLLKAEVAKLDKPQLRAVVPAQIRPRNRGADADDLYQILCEDWPVTAAVRGASIVDAAYTAGEPITAWDASAPIAQDLERVYGDLVERGVLA